MWSDVHLLTCSHPHSCFQHVTSHSWRAARPLCSSEDMIFCTGVPQLQSATYDTECRLQGREQGRKQFCIVGGFLNKFNLLNPAICSMGLPTCSCGLKLWVPVRVKASIKALDWNLLWETDFSAIVIHICHCNEKLLILMTYEIDHFFFFFFNSSNSKQTQKTQLSKSDFVAFCITLYNVFSWLYELNIKPTFSTHLVLTGLLGWKIEKFWVLGRHIHSTQVLRGSTIFCVCVTVCIVHSHLPSLLSS